MAVRRLLISTATAICLVVGMWTLNGKIDDLNSKFDTLTDRVDVLATGHTAHLNSGLHAR